MLRNTVNTAEDGFMVWTPLNTVKAAEHCQCCFLFYPSPVDGAYIFHDHRFTAFISSDAEV